MNSVAPMVESQLLELRLTAGSQSDAHCDLVGGGPDTCVLGVTELGDRAALPIQFCQRGIALMLTGTAIRPRSTTRVCSL